MAKYLDFEETDSKPKTRVWNVLTRHGDDFGEIKFYAPWRQYCYVIDDLVFSRQCLKDLYEFVEAHKNDRVGGG